MDVLNSLISLTTFFVKIQSQTSTPLLQQMFVHILFNPSIWIHCSIDVCIWICLCKFYHISNLDSNETVYLFSNRFCFFQ